VIVISFTGGLGNQLFQYAFGRKLAATTGQQLFFEIETYKTDYLRRSFVLNHFDISARSIPSLVQRKMLVKRTKLNNVLNNLGLIEIFEETDFSFKPDFLAAPKWINYYKGFWQTQRYFEDIRELLLEELQCKTDRLYQIKNELTGDNETISIHIRRKDYLNDDRYGFVGEMYYKNAIEYFQNKGIGSKYIVFSDDINWCKTFLSGLENTTFIGPEYNLKDYEELQLMSWCSHHIIANSSFSWWGAWLCKKPNHLVIRPETPFREPSLYYEHHYPENWIALEN